MLLLVGCADLDQAELASQSGDLGAEATDVHEAALGKCPRPCILTKAPPAHAEIHGKVARLDPALREAYFASATTAIAKVPERDAYGQFFAGWAGSGAVYLTPSGAVHAIYGSFLESWARNGFERGWFEFPTSDAYEVSGGLRQDFYVEDRGATDPDYDRDCLLTDVRYMMWDRATNETREAEEQTYYSDLLGQPSTQPQPVTSISGNGFGGAASLHRVRGGTLRAARAT